jgi:hypothetical protein
MHIRHRIFLIVALSILVSACQQNASQPEDSISIVASQGESTPDQAQSDATPLIASEDASPTPQRATSEQYSTIDRPDDNDGYQIHFIYALPRDGVDDFLDVNGEIALSAAAMSYWLEGRTEHRLRYDTYQGDLDISFLMLDVTADRVSELGTNILALIEREIKTRGFNSDHKLYVVHYDGFFVTPEGYCGLASYPPDGAGVSAVLLLRGFNPSLQLACPRQFTKSEDFTGYFEMTILHELLHLMGMVPDCAPNYTDGHVSDSSQDLLYYQYDGSYSPLYTYLDLRNNDYYDHGNPDCPDLAHSVFLDPLPANAELPPAWDVSVSNLPPDPLATENKD